MTIPNVGIPLLVSGLAFLVLCLLFIGILQYFFRHAKKRSIIGKVRPEDKRKETKNEQGSGDSIKKSILDFLESFGRRLGPSQNQDYSRVKIKFLRAGLRNPNTGAVLWGIKILLGLCMPMCFLFIRISVLEILSPALTLTICLFLAFLGFYLPAIWLRAKAATRRNRIFMGFADALDLLVVSVEAGLGLDSAIRRVAEEIELSNKELSDELRLLNFEMRAGKSRQEALRNLALRTDIEDVKNLVTLLIQTDRFGTSVAQALRVYSDVFRTRRYQRAEEIAARLPVKLIFPLILFIFPSLFVVLMGPAAIRIYQTLLKH
jgi:tight adherence protein C